MDLFYAAFMNLTFNGQKPLSLHYNYLNLCVSMMNKGLNLSSILSFQTLMAKQTL